MKERIIPQEYIYRYGEWILSPFGEQVIDRIQGHTILPHHVEIHTPPKTKKLCWLQCSWCYGKYHRVNQETRVSPNRLLDIVSEICKDSHFAAQSASRIVFSGIMTDPLNSDASLLQSLIRTVKGNSIVYGLHSKFISLSNPIREVIVHGGRAGEDYLSISLDAGTSDTYNKVHHLSGGSTFQRVLSNIQKITNIASSGLPKIIVTYLLQEANANTRDIIEAIRWCRDLGVPFIRFSTPQVQYQSNGRSDYSTATQAQLGEAEEIILECQTAMAPRPQIILLPINPRRPIVPPSEDKSYCCHSRWLFPAVGFDGFLYTCCQVASVEFKGLRIADLNTSSFWDAYYRYQYPGDALLPARFPCQCDRKALDVNARLTRALEVRTKTTNLCETK